MATSPNVSISLLALLALDVSPVSHKTSILSSIVFFYIYFLPLSPNLNFNLLLFFSIGQQALM